MTFLHQQGNLEFWSIDVDDESSCDTPWFKVRFNSHTPYPGEMDQFIMLEGTEVLRGIQAIVNLSTGASLPTFHIRMASFAMAMDAKDTLSFFHNSIPSCCEHDMVWDPHHIIVERIFALMTERYEW